MLVLNIRRAQKYTIEETITLAVDEIRGEQVRLGFTPLAGQPVDLLEEEHTPPLERDVRLAEGAGQVLVWARAGECFRLNGNTRVRVIAVCPEQASLGVIDLRKEPCHAATAGTNGHAPEKPRTAQVTAEVLSEWVARKLTEHLKDGGRGAVGKLAKGMGVSPVTINRWRTRQTNVTRENLCRLLEVLGVSLDELAAEHGVAAVQVPDGRPRGPARRGQVVANVKA